MGRHQSKKKRTMRIIEMSRGPEHLLKISPDNLWLELFLFVFLRGTSLSKHEQTRSNQGRYKVSLVCDPNYFG